MAIPKSVWGIDVGQCGLKALKLRETEGELQVDAFDIIEHPKILSQPDADRNQLIRTALEQFLARNNLSDSLVAVAVPGQTSFTRFVKLPPVESSKIPDIVGFEAEQQIPFPISEVLWRWQTFQDPDSPDVEVGIFAMKRADVAEVLDHFAGVGINVDVVQMAPLALYNFMKFDEHVDPEGATLLADIGADKTDLVVADGARIWTRTIQIGGNNFTEALVRAFKLSFAKAEKLKRTAASSKYARQIFQAMRPVFADLVQEIQRCIGYYTSLHRESRFKRLVGLGNGFRLPGLQKFLEQNLNVPVLRVDSYNKLVPSPAVNAPVFTENVLSFAVAYGLALQGLQLTVVNTNLLPSEVARRRLWRMKRPWFVAAAAVLAVAFCGNPYRNYMDRLALPAPADSPTLRQAQTIGDELKRLRSEYNLIKDKGQKEIDDIKRHIDMYGYRTFWPEVNCLISRSIESVVGPEQKLLRDLAEVRDKKAREEIIAELKKTERKNRRIITVDKIHTDYLDNITVADPVMMLRAVMGGGGGGAPAGEAAVRPGAPKRGYFIALVGRTPMEPGQAERDLVTPMRSKSTSIAETLKTVRVDQVVREFRPAAESAAPAEGTTPAAGGKLLDVLGEDASKDTQFGIGWLLSIEGSGVEKIKEEVDRHN